MTSVTYRVEGDIAVIEVNNPPVNALSLHVREGLAIALDQGSNDREVKSFVLHGKNTFLGGADITEFKTGKFYESPGLVELADLIEDSKKPVVAAISGFALGGGFEVAVCCHYRVSDEKSIYGFPEVDLGILPAATGTQRFPRLVGLKAALDLIPSGRRIQAKEALSIGAVDKVVKSDLLKEALTFAKSIANKPFENRRISKMPVRDADQLVPLREAAMKKATQKFRGQLSPIFCIKSVLAAAEFPYDQGLVKEGEYAQLLFTSGQSRALQYAFFAERAAPKWDIAGVGSHKTTKPLPIKTGAVIGAGTMGTGIAMAMLNAGIPVVLLEQDEKFLKKGVGLLQNLYGGSVKLGRMTEAQAKAKLNMLKPTVNYQDISDVDIVIEAVYENMKIKQEVFKKLDKICKPDALLCSNTSTLNIDKMAEVTSRPEKVIGVHFFVPAYHMRLLENIKGAKSSAQTIATVQAFGARLGKVSVLVGNCDAFAANRMRTPQVTEAVHMVEEGCMPQDVDEVAEDIGLPLGPLKISDLSGLDLGASIMKERLGRMGYTLDEKLRTVSGIRVSTLGYSLAQHGRYGRKNAKGFYRYEAPNAKVPHVDPWMAAFLEEYSRARGIERRQIPNQEIQERLLYSCMNEGFKIMEEGICSRPEELDTIWFTGFGWPRYLGGPMFHADTIGLERVYERVCHYYNQHPTCPHWQPSDLLKRLANNNVPFKDWSKHAVSISARL